MIRTATSPDTGDPSDPLHQLHERLLEAYLELGDQFVDPRELFHDDNGTRWQRLGFGSAADVRFAFETPEEHERIRQECRSLATTNEFAINGHENRVSYIVGSGHTYRVVAKKGMEAPEDWVRRGQDILDEFLFENRWQQRQQETVRRRDRDGEAFLRFFKAPGGATRVRFVEPGQVATPRSQANNPAASFGIETEPADVETVVADYIEDEVVPAEQIQHRKANVDTNVKRGLPLYFPVRKNLRRAEKLLRNMSVVAEIQSAIALIRRHASASRANVQRFVQDQADLAKTTPTGGGTTFKRFGPGTILDSYGGLEYDFPAQTINAGNYVIVLQAELRAIASRLVMPEFMLTSDASNANFASTMVAEGPAVKMFMRLQAEQMQDDIAVMWRVLENVVAAGRLPAEAIAVLDVQASPPSVHARDALIETRIAEIQARSGILSPQSWALRAGLDYDQEQENLRRHAS